MATWISSAQKIENGKSSMAFAFCLAVCVHVRVCITEDFVVFTFYSGFTTWIGPIAFKHIAFFRWECDVWSSSCSVSHCLFYRRIFEIKLERSKRQEKRKRRRKAERRRDFETVSYFCDFFYSLRICLHFWVQTTPFSRCNEHCEKSLNTASLHNISNLYSEFNFHLGIFIKKSKNFCRFSHWPSRFVQFSVYFFSR